MLIRDRPWLGGGARGLENVANLHLMPPAGGHVIVGASKVADATGGPARVLGVIGLGPKVTTSPER